MTGKAAIIRAGIAKSLAEINGRPPTPAELAAAIKGRRAARSRYRAADAAYRRVPKNPRLVKLNEDSRYFWDQANQIANQHVRAVPSAIMGDRVREDRRRKQKGRDQANARRQSAADQKVLDAFRQWETKVAAALKGLDIDKRLARYRKVKRGHLNDRDSRRLGRLVRSGALTTN